ncbi:MAG: tyrosine-protein phosphatase [Candidatus Melainabacteria bacterium]|nr:tyrosine-protein phosphatase [Candidatus Melainabacteria bacterium]
MTKLLSSTSKKVLVAGSILATTAVVATVFVERACLANLRGSLSSSEWPLPSEIPNFSEVQPYLYRGALPTPFGMEWLKKHRVKTIIDLREANTPPVIGEQITASAMGFHYVNLPVKNLPTAGQVDQFKSIVANARDNSERVFVHCNYGSDRTGFFVMLWRVSGDRWRVTSALCEMFEHGFFVHKFSENKTKPLADPKNW